MFASDLQEAAAKLLQDCRDRGLRLVTAESCTGGLLAALVTGVPDASDVLERGFVTYSNPAKQECLGIPATLLSEHGAVSEAVARAMAAGALRNAHADLALAITGLAGPGGGTEAKPVGLVHLAAARKDGGVLHRECRFGDIGRDDVRRRALAVALELLREALQA